jgi:prephenate dehydratase
MYLPRTKALSNNQNTAHSKGNPMTKVSIQGVLGSFSHIASEYLFGNVDFWERRDFRSVFEDLISGSSDYAVIPIENSTIGSIIENYNLLSQYPVQIRQEVYLKINFQLITHPGVLKNDITELYTHPAALGQIQKYLKSNPNIKPIEFYDTAASVEYIQSRNLKNSAAVASSKASEIYNMNIMEKNIQDNSKNYTRFFVLEKRSESTLNPSANKTSLQFELGNEVGTLARVLSEFSNRGISLSKIESRPMLESNWEYRFFIDIISGPSQKEFFDALSAIEDKTKNLVVLGTYSKGAIISS